MKHAISFKSNGSTLKGNLFTSNNFNQNNRYNAVIVQGSLTSVKEQMPETYAQKFAEKGFIALAFDYSHYGESEGKPRQLESPIEKLNDLRSAVSYLSDLPNVQSVSMVGVCTSAGNAAYLASDDNRVKALATVAGFLSEPALFELRYGKEKITQLREAAVNAEFKYKETGEETIVTAYSEVDESAANFGPKGSYDYYLNKARGGVPEWRNEFSVMSWNGWLDFNPLSKASSIKIPTLIVHSDKCAFPNQAKQFYSELQGPKELAWGEGVHYDYYDNPMYIDNAIQHITGFFSEHLPGVVTEETDIL